MSTERRPELKAAIEAAAEAIYESEGPESIDDDGAEALAEVAVRAAAPFLAAAALRQAGDLSWGVPPREWNDVRAWLHELAAAGVSGSPTGDGEQR